MPTLMLRLAGFAGAPIISALAPFIILPVISRAVGTEGWANFSAGQSIGILGMVGVLFGWSIIGPVRVARATTAQEEAVILHESIRSRLVTSALAVPAAAIATFLVSGSSYRLESVATAVAMTIGGLTPAWFCIGQGKPRALMLFDALPKLTASAIAVPVVLLTGEVLWYPLLLVAATVPAFAIHARLTAHATMRGEGSPRSLGTVLKALVPTAAIDATGNAYGSTSIPIATAGLESADASSFASADRAYRLATMAVIAMGNAFQAWALEPAIRDRYRRHRLAIASHLGLGLVGGFALGLVGPWATALLFGQSVAAEPIPCMLFGVAFFFISVTTPLIRNILIPGGRFRLVLLATVAAAVVGVTTMVAGSVAGSAELVALGVVASEGTMFVALIVPASRALASLRHDGVIALAELPN